MTHDRITILTQINLTRHKIAQQIHTVTLSTNDSNAKLPDVQPLDGQAWWLLGTSGCHLCDVAEETLRLFSSVSPVKVQKVDIADLDEALMQEFATIIPVILTPTHQLKYPFSVVDLQTLILDT